MNNIHDRSHELSRAAEQRANIQRQAKNGAYRALVSLVAALAKATSGPREALDILKGEIANIEKDVVKAEKKAARRNSPKGDASREEK